MPLLIKFRKIKKSPVRKLERNQSTENCPCIIQRDGERVTKIRLPAKLENLGKFLNFISCLAEQNGFSPSMVKEIELAAEEALINIFNYAYPGNAGEVEISYSKDSDSRLILEISDNGIPFDPLSLSEPNLTANVSDRKVGGLGVIFIRKMTDDVRYRRDGDANVLTLIFSK